MSWRGDPARLRAQSFSTLVQDCLRALQELAARGVDVRGQAAGWGGDPRSLLLSLASGGPEAPLYCPHASLGTVFDYLPLARAVAGRRPVMGLQSRMQVDPEWIDYSVQEMATAYVDVLLRDAPPAGIQLCGWSFGAVLALEMSAQLTRRGHAPVFLGLIDLPLPAPGTRQIDAAGLLADLGDYLRWLYPSTDVARLAACIDRHATQLVSLFPVGDLAPRAASRDAETRILEQLFAKVAEGVGAGADARGFSRAEAIRGFVIRRRQAEALARYRYADPGLSPYCWWARSAPTDACERLQAFTGRRAALSRVLPLGHLAIVRAPTLSMELAAALDMRVTEPAD